MWLRLESKRFKMILLVLVTMLFTLIMAFVDINSAFYRTSILEYPEHQPFDGTVYPIKKVPDWVNLDSTEMDLPYSSLASSDLLDIPFYDPSQLQISTDNLVWGNAGDNMIRNAKITYSVPYMGNYRLDGKENVGSHPAVDIKVPLGTPIFAIANGTVIKASTQSSGFGHHVVIQHNNFPTLDNASANKVLYSSYSHLGDVLVNAGDVVSKGDQIALSGASGTATTPHLHFQIDSDEAPWHPFWPFTWAEASDAGLDFFAAVNAGLGRANALIITVNSMKYVQAYLNSEPSNGNVASDGPPAVSYVGENNDPVEVMEEVVLETEEVAAEEVVPDPPVLNFEIEVRDNYYLGQDASFTILSRDQYGEVFANGFVGEIVVVSDSGLVTVENAILNNRQFDSDGEKQNSFSRMKEGRDRLIIEYNGETFYSDWFEIIDINSNLFSDVPGGHKYYDAIMYLADEGIVEGYDDGTFKPNTTVSRVEALKLILEGIGADLLIGPLPFDDVSVGEWYESYLYTSYKNEIVDGYPDGSFKPSNTVNRAEFLKILFNGMSVDINPNVDEAPYEDVDVNDWFAPYVAYAKKLEIIDPDAEKIYPSTDMTRGEVSDLMYKLMQLFL